MPWPKQTSLSSFFTPFHLPTRREMGTTTARQLAQQHNQSHARFLYTSHPLELHHPLFLLMKILGIVVTKSSDFIRLHQLTHTSNYKFFSKEFTYLWVLSLQDCQQWPWRGKWDVQWRKSLQSKRAKQTWEWMHHCSQEHARQQCQAQPWLWLMSSNEHWRNRASIWFEQQPPWVDFCWVFLVSSGPSTLLTLPLLMKMKSIDCPSNSMKSKAKTPHSKRQTLPIATSKSPTELPLPPSWPSHRTPKDQASPSNVSL